MKWFWRRWQVLGVDGWPVERIRGRWVQNGLRLLIHGRKIIRRRPRIHLGAGPDAGWHDWKPN